VTAPSLTRHPVCHRLFLAIVPHEILGRWPLQGEDDGQYRLL